MLRSTVFVVCSLAVIFAALTPVEEKCVPPLTAKIDAETDEVLKTAIGTALGKYVEGDPEATKSIMGALNDERMARFRDYYLVDECALFRSMFGF